MVPFKVGEIVAVDQEFVEAPYHDWHNFLHSNNGQLARVIRVFGYTGQIQFEFLDKEFEKRYLEMSQDDSDGLSPMKLNHMFFRKLTPLEIISFRLKNLKDI